MASEGGGKVKHKRNQNPSKPYERKSSLFGKLKDSVKDLLIPSWLSGSPSSNQLEAVNRSSTQQPNVEINRSSGNAGQGATDWPEANSLSTAFGSYPIANMPRGNSTPGKLHSSQIPGYGLEAANGELFVNQPASFTAQVPNLTIGSQIQTATLRRGGIAGPSVSNNLDSSPKFLSEARGHSSSFDINQLNEGELTPVRPIMVLTGVDKRTSSQPVIKRQKLSSPDSVRQGKPLVPPARGKPSFNSLLFGTPSKNDVSMQGNVGDSSFYVGKTRFGGASSAKRKDLNTSLPYKSSLPLRKQVKAVKLNNSFHATTSATAQRILDTLERLSTPLEDAKKIPQRDQGNDSILSFTPSSYRKQSSRCSIKPITRPLQLPNRGPPTSQLQSTSNVEIAKNRDRSKVLRPEPEPSLPISQEIISSKESVIATCSTAASVGKMKTKKFSQHMSGYQEEEAVHVPNLRTDFTLPLSSMAPISLSSKSKSLDLVQAVVMSTKSSGASPMKFTFSTPIEEKKSPSGSQVSHPAGQGFKFSSPIHVSQNKTSGAGAEEGSKIFSEPAVGAATPQISMVSSPPMVKPKAVSPDIGGTSSSFKSYTKWNANQKNDNTVPPAFGMPGTATTLKKGSVMDILGGGKSDSSTGSSRIENTSTPLSELFKKPQGSWECSACMIQNKDPDSKCVACSANKPGLKPSGAVSANQSDKPLSEMFKKPKDSWECTSCMIQNGVSVNKCVACATPKTGSESAALSSKQSSGVSLSDIFKKPEGAWECDTCMIQNTSTAVKCVACETPKRGAVPDKSNNSLGTMFKKPEGSWECDTCLVPNSSTSLRCIACDASKPGLQSAGIVSKSFTTNSKIEISPNGGFSVNLPSTSTTTIGSGGFTFGNPSASVISSGGFNANENSKKDTPNINIENKTASVSGGFQFGTTGASVSSSALFQFGTISSGSSSGFQFGAPPVSAGSIVSTSKAGFSSSESASSSASLTVSSMSNTLSTSSVAASKGGFQFGSIGTGLSSTVPVDKKSETNSHSQPTFTFGSTPVSVGQGSPFVFGAQASSTQSSTGLGAGPQMHTMTAQQTASLVNGGFGTSSNNKQFSGSDKSGPSTSTNAFSFGVNQSSNSLSSSGSMKRSVGSSELGAPSAKLYPVFGSVSKEPVLNGGFSFTDGPASSLGNSASFTFGTSKTSQSSTSSSGGFQFSSSVPSNQLASAVSTNAFNFTAGPGHSNSKKSEVSFNATPNFNFAAPADKNSSSSVFQFGAASAPETPSSHLFTFGASSNPVPQPSAPVFGASSVNSAVVGSFSMGSSDTGQRKMKKAVRRIKPR